MKTALLTLADGPSFFEQFLPSMEEAAECLNIDFIRFDAAKHPNLFKRSPNHVKLLAILDCFKDYEGVWWADADIKFFSEAFPKDFLDKYFYSINKPIIIRTDYETPIKEETDARYGISLQTGSFFVKKHKIVRSIFFEILNKKEQYKFLAEQSGMNLEYEKYKDYFHVDDGIVPYNVYFLEYREGDPVCHFAGPKTPELIKNLIEEKIEFPEEPVPDWVREMQNKYAVPERKYIR